MLIDFDALETSDRSQRAEACSPVVTQGFSGIPRTSDVLAPRRLFRLSLHGNSGYATAIVSEPTRARKGGEKFALRLWLNLQGAAPTVVAVDDVCTACVALGVDGQGATCVECGGVGWERWFGESDVPLSLPNVETLRCHRPKVNLYVDAYQLP